MAQWFTNVVIESESTTVIGLVGNDTSPLYPYAPLIKKIRQFHILDWTIDFNHNLREGNKCMYPHTY